MNINQIIKIGGRGVINAPLPLSYVFHNVDAHEECSALYQKEHERGPCHVPRP